MFIIIIIPETMMPGYVLWQVQMQDVIYQLSVLTSHKAVGLKGVQRVACCHIVKYQRSGNHLTLISRRLLNKLQHSRALQQ